MQKIKRAGMMACAAFIALSLATPASAAWYIFVELASVEPSNEGILGGSTTQNTSGPGTFTEASSVLAADIGDDFGGTIGVGFEALDGIVGVAYTTSSGDETSAPRAIDGNGTPQIFFIGMSDIFYAPQTGSATVSGDIERSTLDVMYFRFMNPGDGPVTTHWNFGLRSATFEEMIVMNATGDNDGGGNPSSLVDNYMLDVDALGFSFGGGAEVEICKHFSVYGNLGASIMMSEAEESAVSVNTLVGFVNTDSVVHERDGSGLIWDIAVGGKVFKRENIQIGIEYQLSSWNGLVGRQALGTSGLNGPYSPSRENIAFHGVAVNALFRVGGN